MPSLCLDSAADAVSNSPPEQYERNLNLRAWREKKRYRLEVRSRRVSFSATEFTGTLRQAVIRKEELERAGFRVTVFAVLASGGLTFPQ